MALRRVNQRVNQRVSRAQCSFAAWVLGTRNDTDINVDMDPPHSPHNHFTTRRGMRAKYKQPYVAQSEVTCTHSHLVVYSTLTISRHDCHHLSITITGLRARGLGTAWHHF